MERAIVGAKFDSYSLCVCVHGSIPLPINSIDSNERNRTNGRRERWANIAKRANEWEGERYIEIARERREKERGGGIKREEESEKGSNESQLIARLNNV